ncbi:MAG: sensor histidine kinase [Turicibacter sp.]
MKNWLVGTFIALCASYMTIIYFLWNQMKNLSSSVSVEVKWIMYSSLIFVCLILILLSLFLFWIRSQLVSFTTEAAIVIDKLMNQEEVVFNLNQETLLAKLQYKLKQLSEVIQNREVRYTSEKDSIKVLIGDISHQIKTPIANITMYNETLLNRQLDTEQQKMCLVAMQSQTHKLDSLVQALIKMSRLENGVIQLSKSDVYATQLIAHSLSGVYPKSQAKDIEIKVDCNPEILISCDKVWTGEVIFNLIENAVKYTQTSGEINIKVEQSDMFTSVSVQDNGMGINKEEVNDIFKRFYRANEAQTMEGVGIGLYLAREIIMKQNGYIKVNSQKGMGSTFSIHLPRE